ncbi:MAG TPA: IS110 family transposase [Thermodesulfobacteriota bacterium]|nr:IS110 family transposase [Thermodesulfobacteriota bacterium]
MYSLLVGIDVSKDFFVTAGIDSEGKGSFSRSYSMDSNGFDDFLKTITSHGEDLSKVIVAMESTGCYHINLFSFLASQGVRTVVVNPLLIANFAKLSLRKTKTDKKDAMTIARFLLDHHEEVSHLSLSQDHQDLRDLSREREPLCHLIAAAKVEIKRVLKVTFPEFQSIGNLYTGAMLRFLQQYPSARLARAAKSKAIVKALKQPYVGNKLTYSAEDILRAANTSIGTVSSAKEIILEGKIATLLHLQGRLDEMTKLLTDLCKATRIDDLKILRSIKGVGPKTAAPFLAEMGEVQNYSSHKKLIAFTGIDPSLHESGNYVGMSKLSKRGNRHLRRAVYLMTAAVVSKNPFFKAYFLRRKREGLPPQKALFATAHKLLRVIFAMLTQRTYFNPKEVI